MIVSVPHINSEMSLETTSKFKEMLKVVTNLDDVDHLGPPCIDLTNLKVRDYSYFGVKNGPEIQCNVELQCFDYWQPNSNFKFTKYPIYGGYLLPNIPELYEINEFTIYNIPFKVIRDKETFFKSDYRWISIYSLFFFSLDEIKKLLSHGHTKVFFSEESYDRCFLAFIKVFQSIGVSDDEIVDKVSFVGGTGLQNNKRLFTKFYTCPITMIHPTYFDGCDGNFEKIIKTTYKPKNILYLVRKPRNHRIIPLVILNHKTDIKDHIITYPLHTPRSEVNYKNLHDGKEIKQKQSLITHLKTAISERMIGRYEYMANKELDFPLTAEYSDGDEINTISWTTMIEPNVKNFMYSKISLVSETYGFNDELNHENPSRGEVFLTEKTGRCLYYGHPFVLVSTMNSLRFLKNCGFDTYDEFLDNEYDETKNDFDRFESATLSSIDFVNRWDNIDKIKLNEVIKRNQTHFTNKFIPNIFKNIYEK